MALRAAEKAHWDVHVNRGRNSTEIPTQGKIKGSQTVQSKKDGQ